jgi:hypothetical protein
VRTCYSENYEGRTFASTKSAKKIVVKWRHFLAGVALFRDVAKKYKFHYILPTVVAPHDTRDMFSCYCHSPNRVFRLERLSGGIQTAELENAMTKY